MAESRNYLFVFVGVFVIGNVVGGIIPNDITSCSTVCQNTFQDNDQSFCIRGCRLMSVLGFIHGSVMTMNELRDSCLGACGEAYALTNASSCAFGCQAQLPAVEFRKNQMMQLSMNFDEAGLFMMSRRFADYSNRMMNCLLDNVNHHISVGWVAITSYTSTSDGSSVIIVSGSPARIIMPNSEYKMSMETSVESNLEANDGSATADLRNSQLLPKDFVDKAVISIHREESSGTHYSQSDWLSCLSAKTHLSKVTILLMLFSLLAVLIWFLISVCFTNPQDQAAAYPKLSIYGDLEYLPLYDEKLPLFEDEKQAAPLPLKIQKI